MGISETIVAAMIGAMATVTAALFRLFTDVKARAKEARAKADPQRSRRGGSATRSILAILALMSASAAGGFLYSELIREQHNEEVRAVRHELKELRELTARVAHESQSGGQAPRSSTNASVGAAQAATEAPLALDETGQIAESMAYVPACRKSAGESCLESEAQRIALCVAIPAQAQAGAIELFAQPDAVQHAWDEHRVRVEQDLGAARFTGSSFEYVQGESQKAVCVNFLQWSSEHPYIARIVVHYANGTFAPLQPDSGAPAVVAAGESTRSPGASFRPALTSP